MGFFIFWLLITLLCFGGMTISGYKAKEAWDKLHHSSVVEALPNVSGDFVIGNKMVTENYMNVTTDKQILMDNASKAETVKIIINRALENFSKMVNKIEEEYPRESSNLVAQFNARNTVGSSEHIKAQMELSIITKRKLDKAFEDLKRNIEDVLIKYLGETSLLSAGVDFKEEQQSLSEAQKRCQNLYPLLNNTPRNLEQSNLKEIRLTKDFNVANE